MSIQKQVHIFTLFCISCGLECECKLQPHLKGDIQPYHCANCEAPLGEHAILEVIE